ncbi:MAG: hypothetical protein ACK46G_07760 [Flavobacteriales bacterium]|jgi:hypothetical protein
MSKRAEDNGAGPDLAEAAWPQYRRMADGRHYYRIEGPDRFTELQRVGSRWLLHAVHATMYPEMLRIQEMLNGGEGVYMVVDGAEWEAICPG